MKLLVYLMLVLAVVGCAKGQNSQAATPEWKVILKVLDETGKPVPGAKASVDYYIIPPPGQTKNWERIESLTDTNGIFTASHADTGSTTLGVHIERTGFYPSHVGYSLGTSYDSATWQINQTLVLKKMIDPVPMYAKWLNTHVPVLDKPMGFDLMVGDWVTPNGRGKDADVIFTAHLDKRAEDDFDYKLVVSFPNPGDGIQPFIVPEAEKTSTLRSPQMAAEDGYKPEWVKTQNRRPGEPSRILLDENLNFFFRVRTVLDEKGNVKSALYGKIYGDFMNFKYYLNPTANSRNIEFDPNLNLLKGLKFTEQVKKP